MRAGLVGNHLIRLWCILYQGIISNLLPRSAAAGPVVGTLRPMPDHRAGPLSTGVKYFVGCYLVVFAVLIFSFAVGAPAWFVGVVTFVALLGLAALVVRR